MSLKYVDASNNIINIASVDKQDIVPAGTVVAFNSDDDTQIPSGWEILSSPPIATTTEAGLMSAADKTKLDNIAANLYPVGSIYISTTDTNPSEYFNGTWERFGKGQVLVGVNEDDTDFVANKSGGAKTTSFTPSGTIGGTAITQTQLPNVTFYNAKHSHSVTDNGHSHGVSGTSHSHVAYYYTCGSSYGVKADSDSGYKGQVLISGGSGVSTSSASMGSIDSATTGVSIADTTITVTSGGNGDAHTHTFTGTKGSVSTVQPYITVYMWKKISD